VAKTNGAKEIMKQNTYLNHLKNTQQVDTVIVTVTLVKNITT